MNSAWCVLYGVTVISIATNYWFLRKLSRAERLIGQLQTIIRGMNANRKGQAKLTADLGEPFRAIPSRIESQDGGGN